MQALLRALGHELVSNSCENARQSMSKAKTAALWWNIPVKQEIIPQMIMHIGRYKEGLPIQLRNIFLSLLYEQVAATAYGKEN